jgi:hypothetical protein
VLRTARFGMCGVPHFVLCVVVYCVLGRPVIPSTLIEFWYGCGGFLQANSPENVATAVRELENALKWDAMMPVWAGVRREWLQQIEREDVTVAQVASCILTMVSNMKRTAFIHVFKFDEYTAKLRNLMSGASSGYSASKEMCTYPCVWWHALCTADCVPFCQPRNRKMP